MKTCKKGHGIEYTKSCPVCHVEAQRKYSHTERGKQTLKKYRVSPKGKARDMSSRHRRYHYSELGEQVRQRVRRWYADNRAKRILTMRAYDAKQKLVNGSRKLAYWARQVRNAV